MIKLRCTVHEVFHVHCVHVYLSQVTQMICNAIHWIVIYPMNDIKQTDDTVPLMFPYTVHVHKTCPCAVRIYSTVTQSGETILFQDIWLTTKISKYCNNDLMRLVILMIEETYI